MATRATRATSARTDKVANTLVDAAVAHKAGDIATAKRLYRKVLKAQPGHFKALRLSGALAHETGDIDEAIKLLNAAVRHAPSEETGALEDLGLLYLHTGEQEKAERLLRRAVEIDGTSLVALSRLGSTLITAGRALEGVDVLERARALAPGDPQIAYALAHALLEGSEFDRAVEIADIALGLRADDPAALLVKGVALFQAEHYAEAAQVLGQAVSREPEDANAWLHLGRARMRAGDDDGANAALAKAAELAPELANVVSQRVNLHSAAGRYDAAVAVADEYLARQRSAAAPLLAKALALRDSGQGEQADVLIGLDELVVVEPIDTPARFDDIAAFNVALERMIRNHPSFGHVNTNRATCGGVQTGSLMIEPPPEMRALARVIDSRIRAVKQALRTAGRASHPWARIAPNRWFVNAWAIVLREQGHQLPHIHPEAWLSGVYYVATPANAGGDGWLELGGLTDDLVAQVPPAARRIVPEPGLLVSFPSYLPQQTLPFSGTGERVSIAFDVFAAPA